MEKSQTLNFLKTTRLALIACADESLLNNFFNYIFTINFSEPRFAIKAEVGATISRKEVAQELSKTMECFEANNIFVPFNCDKYSELRSVYFYLPETAKPHVQIFVLKEADAGVKLECEIGVLQGNYILFNYDKACGTFTEIE